MPKVVVHPGFVKTATSTLQMAVFPKLEGVNYLGMPADDPKVASAISALCQVDGVRYDSASLRGALTRHLDDERINVISHENFTYYRSKDKSLIAYRIKELFPDAKIIFTIRNQRDLIRSWYLQKRRPHRPFMSFKTWWKNITMYPYRTILDDVEFDSVIGCYEQLFGPENVGVFLYEVLRDKPDLFSRDVAALTGMNADAMTRALERNRLNPSVTTRHLAFSRFVTNYVPAALADTFEAAVPVKAMARFREWQARGARPKIRLSTKQDRYIINLCAAGNRRLAERRGLPLQQFDYPL